MQRALNLADNGIHDVTVVGTFLAALIVLGLFLYAMSVFVDVVDSFASWLFRRISVRWLLLGWLTTAVAGGLMLGTSWAAPGIILIVLTLFLVLFR